MAGQGSWIVIAKGRLNIQIPQALKKYYVGGKIYKNRPCRPPFERQADVAYGVVTVPCAHFALSLLQPSQQSDDSSAPLCLPSLATGTNLSPSLRFDEIWYRIGCANHSVLLSFGGFLADLSLILLKIILFMFTTLEFGAIALSSPGSAGKEGGRRRYDKEEGQGAKIESNCQFIDQQHLNIKGTRVGVFFTDKLTSCHSEEVHNMSEAIVLAISKIDACLANGSASKNAISKLYKKENRVKELPNKMEQIKRQLDSTNEFILQQIGTEHPSDPLDENWIATARRLAIIVEDVMHKYLHHALRLQEEGSQRHPVKGPDYATVFGTMVDVINNIIIRIGCLLLIGEKIHPTSQPLPSQHSPAWLQDSFARSPSLNAYVKQKLIGTDGAVKQLLEFLMPREDESVLQAKVLSIMGLGGIGKTALAIEVYRNLQRQFGGNAFVTVSKKPDMKRILRDILCQISLQNYSADMNETQLISQIGQNLKDRRYLLVLDDLWDTKPWETIKSALPDGNSGCRVIVTTRLISIAKTCCSGPPYSLESCSLYLSTYPENHKIERDSLIRKWIAEGIIPEESEHSLEDVANMNFDELINRNVIQQVDNNFGEDTYEINSIMVYIIRKISQERNFATFIFDVDILGSCCSDLDNSDMDDICHMILLQYLSLSKTQITELPPEIANLRHLKTLAVTQTHITKLPPQIGKLQSLEALDVRDTRLKELPKELVEMQKLKKLDLRQTQINDLPMQIRKLENLRTLDVRQTQLKELPKDLIRLPNLTHLLFGQSVFHGGMKLLVGGNPSKSLKVLGAVDSRQCSTKIIEELSGLTELRELAVVCYDGPDDNQWNHNLLNSISNFRKLQSLTIYGDFNLSNVVFASSDPPQIRKLKVAGRCLNVPDWFGQFTNTAILDIRVCRLEENDLRILGNMSSLRRLVLTHVHLPTEELVVSSDTGFEKLEAFALDSRVPWVTFEMRAMPSLEHLELKLYAGPGGEIRSGIGPARKKIPSGIVHLGSLMKIIIRYSLHYKSSVSVANTIDAITKEAREHDNLMVLSVNVIAAEKRGAQVTIMELVVGASEATMRSLLSKLGGLLSHEYALIRSVRGDIQYIRDELMSMQAFLRDLRAGPEGHGDDHDHRMKDWMKQIRDVTYDIEDCIDDFAHRLSHDPGGDIVMCGFVVSRAYELLTWRPRRDIASNIAELKMRAQQIGERRTRYGVENPKKGDQNKSGPAATTINGFDAAGNQQHTNLELVGVGGGVLNEPVGVVDDMTNLAEWVTNKDIKEGVLSILGFGGVGKTTIATALYRKLGDQFDRRAMVTVSQSSDVEAILRSILAQVMPQSKDGEEQQQQEKRFIKEHRRPATSKMMKKKKRRRLDRSIAMRWHWQDDDGGGGSLLRRRRRNNNNRATQYSDDGRLQGDKFTVTAISNLLGCVLTKQSRHRAPQQGATSVGNFEKKKTSINIGTMKLEDLSKELKNHLKDKRYFLLIDDVWSVTTWEQIRKYLPSCEKGSRILVTTRFSTVATACKRKEEDRIHNVKALCGEEPGELFKQVVMSESKVNRDTIDFPPRIWEMCGGLPLAIVTMAGFVACNPEKQQQHWIEVCKSLVPESGKVLSQDGVTRILSHCYNDMPAELRTCCLYLSIFPKGSKISRKRLTRRWIAEGFVSEKQGLSVEDVAEACFNHLMRRKIIRRVEHSSNGKVKNCQVHDMVLEYIVSKASEENFVTVVGGHWLMPPPSSKVRRLAIQSGDSKCGSATDSMNLSHVRSLTMFGSLSQLPSNSFKFGIVQVLDLQGCKGFKQHHAKEICKMLLIKYLSLRRTDVKKLPKNIGKLQYLETLDIRETNVTKLPKSVCLLERVVNILGGNKRTRKALKLPEDVKKTMKALRILSGIEIVGESTSAADFHHLTDLRKLAIFKINVTRGDKLSEDLRSSIEYLGGYSLHSLVIDDDSSEFLESLGALSCPPKFLISLELSGTLVDLPRWITQLQDLTKLTLSVTALRTDNLRHICQLKKLFSLTFSLTEAKSHPLSTAILEDNKTYSDGEILVPAGGFEKLKILRFSAPLLPILSFQEKAMPSLERLELRFSILEGLFGIQNLESLKEVHLRVNYKAGAVTKSIVENVATAAKKENLPTAVHKDDKGPIIIVDQYYD
uniref:Disease resistance protein RPM1 n=1 Tax=Oryza glumipatula TaxID=40148 RepID=A0A0E0BM98_9ORYZ